MPCSVLFLFVLLAIAGCELPGDCCTDPSFEDKYSRCCNGKCCSRTSCCGTDESEVCCKPYEVCCAGTSCCDRQNCCGSSCCLENERCLETPSDGLLCCPRDHVCLEECCLNCCDGRYCCNDTSVCCGSSFCCPIETHKCCGEICCLHTETCCGQNCCERGTSQCGMAFDMDLKSPFQECAPYGREFEERSTLTSSTPSSSSLLKISFFPLDEGDGTVIECVPDGSLFLVDFSKDGPGFTWRVNNLRSLILGLEAEEAEEEVEQKQNKWVKGAMVSFVNGADVYSYLPKIFQDELPETFFVAGRARDHRGAVASLLAKNIDNVREVNRGLPCLQEDCLLDSNPIFSCGDGDGDGQAIVEIVASGVGLRKSIVTKISVGNFSLVLPGGLIGDEETVDLVDEREELLEDVTVFKLSSHGALDDHTNIEELTAVVNPEVVIVSNGKNGNHPACDLISRMTRNGRLRRYPRIAHLDEETTPSIQCSHRFWKGKVPHYVSLRVRFCSYFWQHLTPWLWDVFSTAEENEEGIPRIIEFRVDSNGVYDVSFVPVVPRENFLSKKQQTKWNSWWAKRRVKMKRPSSREVYGDEL